MPALVNSSVGSSSGTTLLDGTNVWPCFLQKKSMNCWRISIEVGMSVQGGRNRRARNEADDQRDPEIPTAVGRDGSPDDDDQLVDRDEDHESYRQKDRQHEQ